MISASVAESAVIAHGLQKLESNEQKRMRLRQSMENAKWMTMVNGLGLCLMSIKGRSKAQLVPMAMLLTGTCLFSNVIFYEAFSKDERLHFLIKYGGASTILGWLAMTIV